MTFRHDQNNIFVCLFLFMFMFLFTSLAYSNDLEYRRVKLYGVWDGAAFQVNKLRYKFARKNPDRGLISGVIEKSHPKKKRLSIGPFRIGIAWNKRTQFLGITEDELVDGKSIKVSVHLSDYGVLIADRLTPGPSDLDPGEVQIIGNISDTQTLVDGSTRAMILGTNVSIPEQLTSVSLQLIRRQDDRRPEDQLSVQLFGRPLVIGGEVGINSRFRKDLRLDPQRDDDRLDLTADFQLELFYKLASNLFLFAELGGGSDTEIYRQGGRDRSITRALGRGETWLFWGDIGGGGLSFQIGRQNYQDRREWWWDENLDSIRFYYNQPFFHTELAVAQEFAVTATDEGRIDPQQRNVLRALGRARWEWADKQVLSVFFLHQYDHSKTERIGDLVTEEYVDANDTTMTWAGLRSLGKLEFDDIGEFAYWMDTAWVGGKEIEFDHEDVSEGVIRVESIDRRHIQGWAVDVGLTWETGLPLDPSFTFGYAIGSSDFRQTGLHDNNNRFNGVDRFRYYGEILRPELANLHIGTVSAGIPMLDNSSVEFVYHYYHQVNARDVMRSSRISADLTGTSGEIGHEWDLVIGLEEWQHLELEFVAGMFRAGSAYGELEGNMAYLVLFKANYNF